MSRILVLIPGLLDPAALAARVAEDSAIGIENDTILTHRNVPLAGPSPTSPADRVMGEVAVLEAGLGAEGEGFDAVVIDAFDDCGLAALRSALSIPVVGPGRASLLYALTLGHCFSVIVPAAAFVRTRAAVRDYGLARHCVSLPCVDWPPEGGEVEALVDAARAAVADGAEIVCWGATSMHRATRAVAAAIPVPVVDPRAFALKLAESLLALGVTHSRRAYPEPMVRKDHVLRALVGRAGVERA